MGGFSFTRVAGYWFSGPCARRGHPDHRGTGLGSGAQASGKPPLRGRAFGPGRTPSPLSAPAPLVCQNRCDATCPGLVGKAQ